MGRRTKIVCTLGPASSDRSTIRSMIEAGMDVARLNFSHGTHEEHRARIEITRQEAERLGRTVAIMQDLQGPKIRIGDVGDGEIEIREGNTITLTADPVPVGDSDRVHVSYDTLADDVEVGGRILVDDGLLELSVQEVRARDVLAKVVVGGLLKSKKGVHIPLMRNTRPPLTEKDLADLEFGLSVGVDVIALSFVRSESDLQDLAARVATDGRRVDLVAKIEKPEAVACIDSILEVADAIMVARGDLGIEMKLSSVPGAQKLIVSKCLAAAKPVITATQMLESMMSNPRPTRAEVSDVANAVLDGSDAVMLSGETAAGRYPVRVVQVMAEIIDAAESRYPFDAENRLYEPEQGETITESVSQTACHLAGSTGAVAIACLTATGTTAKAIARHRPSVPVYAFTDDVAVVRRLSLLWGTKGFAIPFQHDTDSGVEMVHRVLGEAGLVRPDDRVVITAGMPLPRKGRTNMVLVSRVSS